MSAKKKAGHIAAMVAGGIVLAVGLAFLLGFAVQALWNWLMPAIFDLPEITYWQAWGLFILAHILVGGAKFHHGDHKDDGFKKKLKDRFKGRHFGSSAEEQGGAEPAPEAQA